MRKDSESMSGKNEHLSRRVRPSKFVLNCGREIRMASSSEMSWAEEALSTTTVCNEGY